MKKQQFLNELCDYLEENLPGVDTEEILEFYDGYFDEHIKLGEQEEKIAEELGDPRLIGKTIIDANFNKVSGSKEFYREAGSKAEEQPDIKAGIGKKRFWLGIAGFALSMVVLYFVLRIFMLVGLFLPVFLVIGAVMWFFNSRRR